MNSIRQAFNSWWNPAPAKAAAPTVSYKHRRANELYPTIQILANQMSIQVPEFRLTQQIADSAKMSDTILFLPYLFAINAKDIPAEYRVSGPSDPKLQSDSFLQKFSNWSKDLFAFQRTILNDETREALKFFLVYSCNPTLSKQGTNFLIAHELAHSFHEHTHGSILPQEFKPKPHATKLALLITFLIGCALVVIFALHIHLLPVVLIAASLVLIVLLSSPISRELYKAYISRSYEYEADATSIKYAPACLKGAIHFFETYLQLNPSSPNPSWFDRHPTDAQRIQHLKKLEKDGRL